MKNYLKSLILIMLAILLLTGCGKSSQQTMHHPEVTGVTIATVALGTGDDLYETIGTVKANQVSYLSSRIMGQVQSLSVNEGDQVQAGQVLLTLSASELGDKVSQASAAIGEAEKLVAMAEENRSLQNVTYERYSQLYKDQALSQHEMDRVANQMRSADLQVQQAQSTLAKAQAAYNEAASMQDYAVLRAPVQGIVVEKKVDVGSMAVAGQPLLAIEAQAGHYVEASLDERFLNQLQPGQNVSVYFDALGQEMMGRIETVIPQVDPATRTFKIKLTVPQDLPSGLFAKVRVPVGTKQALLIPEQAVVTKGQLTGVYVVNEEGLITYRLVKTSSVKNGQVEVLTGLGPNEKIIVAGVENAVDGGLIKEVTS